ncbi:MAG: DUF1569 domain-containing protein [Terracidiphilus sp.]
MKTLANPTDRDQILRRLQTVLPTSPRRWGAMSAHQMICHVTDVFRSSMGEKDVSLAPRILPRPPMRYVALWLPFPWPPGVPARPEWDQQIAGTAPIDFEEDRQELLRILARFTGQPLGFAWREHAIFGRMSHAEWQRLGYRHMDHHLRQFGA